MPFQKGHHHSGRIRRKISEAQKGQKNHNYGKHFSEEHRRKISEAKKGKHHSEEHRRRNSEAKRGQNNPNYGKHLPEETRKKMSEAQRGDKSHRWKGGRIPYYGPDWQYQRNLARERDNYTCLCGAMENGKAHDVHHIVPYRISKDNSQDNLWTLCSKCHRTIEAITFIGLCDTIYEVRARIT